MAPDSTEKVQQRPEWWFVKMRIENKILFRLGLKSFEAAECR